MVGGSNSKVITMQAGVQRIQHRNVRNFKHDDISTIRVKVWKKKSLKKIECIVFINFEFCCGLFRIYMNNKCYSVGVDIFSGGERHGVGPGLAAFAL